MTIFSPSSLENTPVKDKERTYIRMTPLDVRLLKIIMEKNRDCPHIIGREPREPKD